MVDNSSMEPAEWDGSSPGGAQAGVRGPPGVLREGEGVKGGGCSGIQEIRQQLNLLTEVIAQIV